MFFHRRFTFALLLAASICVPRSTAQTANQRSLKTITVRTSEGTDLGFDLSADGRSIAFDLLGQLWLVPAQGGKARPITDAVRDAAEDLDPSFAPDGRAVVFRGERNGRTGLWLLSLNSGQLRQLTQLANPDGFDRNAAWSPDGRFIAFEHAVPPDPPGRRWRVAIMLLEVATGNLRELSVTGIPVPNLYHPVWVRDGRQIAFISPMVRGATGGRIWIVDVAGGIAKPITAESVQAQAPALTSDDRRIAYFAPDEKGRTQVWVQALDSNDTAQGSPIMVTNHKDVTANRIRWERDCNTLLYSADGRLWKVAAAGGEPTEIRFTAELSITRRQNSLPPARFPEPGTETPARGFMGLALSPDARQIAVLMLGKLWLITIGASPRAVANVPFDANSIAWSPDGSEIAWSAGVPEQADLFATDLTTGATRRITALPGREANAAYSPDGRYLAFVYMPKDEATLRVVEARAGNVTDATQTRDLGSIPQGESSVPPQWSPESDGLLVSGTAARNQQATFLPLSGAPQTLKRFTDGPIFLQWTPQHTIVFVRHDRLWQAPFDRTGMLADPKPLGNDAALYASAARDGSVLFVSEGGLRLRSPNGEERRLGWPISYTPPVAEPLLIRNVRIIDGTGKPIIAARDILIERGRIARIAPTQSIAAGKARVIDAAGRVVIPGLMDLHAHTYRPDFLPGFLYFGVTTVRDQGSSMAPMVAYADAIAAGALPGPRVGYGGFQFYSDYEFDSEQWQGLEPEADPEHIKRAVDLAEAFGAQHIKTRTFRRWDINARMIEEAHRRGLRATGHCSHPLPLVAAGMDAKEHIGACAPRGDTYMYDDLTQLFRVAGIGVVPTISYLELAVELNQNPALLDQDAELAPFMPARDNFGWMFDLQPNRQFWVQMLERSRETTAKLSRAGITLGTGTDIWQIPTGVHLELEQMVAAGLSPIEAIHAGTGGAARILGADKDLGTIEVGKWADLIILDADPLADIRNTRRIWQVVHNGQVVDRTAILKVIKPR